MTLIHPEKLSGSTSSGAFTVNTQKLNGVLRQVIVNPTTPTTIYDVSITNYHSNTVYERASEQGELSEEVQLPAYGIHTVAITNATNDESFSIQLVVED